MNDGRKYMIGLSGGINSMAVLMWLIEQEDRPEEIYIFYAHFAEHSPDTFQFVADGIRYARKHFKTVHVQITNNSILQYFEKENIIPHPANSPCTLNLKIKPINAWAFEQGISVDLVGYVKHELKRRAGKQQKVIQATLFGLEKHYPIGDFTDDWCFDMCMKHLGWYPAIYHILNAQGLRVFKHNNCLPCKNMYPEDVAAVRDYYPEYYLRAMELSAKIARYWGRNKEFDAEFYSSFGRDLGQDSTCEVCKF